jgi:segregation and condensation protein A
VFQRGWPQPVNVEKQVEWGDTLIDLLQVYADRRQRKVAHRTYEIKRMPVWTLKEARTALERMLGQMDDWGRFDAYLLQYMVEPEKRASVIASGFTASLELAREGVLEVRQEKAFEPIYMRRARTG